MTEERLTHGLNMDGWFGEKAEGVVRHLGRLCQKLPALGATPDAKDAMASELHPALYNATKLLAFSFKSLAAWSPEDAAFVMRGGDEAVRMLVYRYRTGKNMDVWPTVGAFLDAIEPLLDLGNPANRTLIYDLLRQFPKTASLGPVITEIADMVEERTMGNISWEDFVARAKRLVAARRAEGGLDKASWLVPPVPPVYGEQD